MISSPLRYPGGKAKLFPFFSELIVKNGLGNHLYCEPFAGGAGLAVRLLTSGFVERISINDIDQSVYSFWTSVFRNTDALCSLIERTPITIREWHRQKAIFENCDISDQLALGFAAYFLNRTNRSGILDGAGPIGGFAQDGVWKIDARFVKEKQIANIFALARFSASVEISNLDALDYIAKKMKRQSSFLYLDPPYFVKGQKLYKNFYFYDDHAKIAATMHKRRNFRWVISYDDAPEIRDLYASFPRNTYLLNYSAGEKGVGQEIMFASDRIVMPELRILDRNAA